MRINASRVTVQPYQRNGNGSVDAPLRDARDMFASSIMDSDDSPRPLPDGSPPPAPLPQKYLGSPTDFLKGVVGKRVIVRLTSGVDYQGPAFVQVFHGFSFF